MYAHLFSAIFCSFLYLNCYMLSFNIIFCSAKGKKI
nr:MAG TPA: hypothetical protein [Caudoviricetes sp.]